MIFNDVNLDMLSGDELLQSGFWGAFRSRFGWEPLALDVIGNGATGTVLLLSRKTLLGTFVYCPLGPQMEPTDGGGEAYLRHIANAARSLLPPASFAIRFDLPWPEDASYRLENAAPAVQPKSTVILDLRRKESVLLSEMKSKTRYNIRLAERHGVIVSEKGPSALEDWYQLHRDMARRQGITCHGERYFHELFATVEEYPGRAPRLLLLMAEYAGEAVAGIIVSLYGSRARYLYGASSDRHRNVMPNYLLQWTAMKMAREAGCFSYDLFGIPRSADPSLPMAGLYRMKTGFGGRILHRAGAYEEVLKPIRHAGFRAAEAIRSVYFRRSAASS